MRPTSVSSSLRSGFRSASSAAAVVLWAGLLGSRPLEAQTNASQSGGGQTSQQPAAPPEPWMNLPPTSTGLAVGAKIPAFRAPDQNGQIQDFNSIRGPKGAAIYFQRSADW